MPRRVALFLVAFLPACGEEVILHRLDEVQANQVLVALGEAGVAAQKGRDPSDEATFAVAVRPSEASRARGVLSARDLPRTRTPGFAELFASSGLVPSPLEEHVRYLHALSGELSRTVEAIDGVVAARVHLALPVHDPLQPEARQPPRASLLVKCAPGSRARLEAQVEGLRRLVAGAAEGLDPSSVAVVLAESSPPPARPSDRTAGRPWMAGSALALALLLGAGAVTLGRRRPDAR
jgi:type III secretion protein J